MELNIDYINKLLASDDKHVIGRALVALNERQTEDEQRIKTTKYRNGRGFRPCHAHMGTSMANFYADRNHLTPKQVTYWTKPTQKVKNYYNRHQKVSRISLYAGQLLKVAVIKQGLKNCSYLYKVVNRNHPWKERTAEIEAWCKENIAGKWFVNPENPFEGIYFADEGDKILCGLKWS